MTAPSDTLVRVEAVALALGISMNQTRRAYLKGNFPAPDEVSQGQRTHHPVLCWRLSTLRAHDPHLARRCAAILAALDSLPLKEAA